MQSKDGTLHQNASHGKNKKQNVHKMKITHFSYHAQYSTCASSLIPLLVDNL